MSNATNHTPPSDTDCAESLRLRGDSFSSSVMLLIGVMLSQRAIGLVRNVVFCGMLSDEELGRWALANNYIGWAAPFVILGLPGSFGRLSEHFRHRGQLRTMLRRTAIASIGLVLVAVTLHIMAPAWFAKLIYNQAEQAAVVPLLGLVLGTVIVMNFLIDFLVSLRRNRIVSRMYLIQSLGFAVLSVVLLVATPFREEALLAAFGTASAIAGLIGLACVASHWRDLPAPVTPEPPATMWRKVGSLAVWIWCGNAVANMFECADQFLLKHCRDLPPTIADAMIGQLYASRVLPVLIVSVATLISGCLLPYLIQDWELGRHEQLRQRMNSVIKFCALGFTVIAALTHIASPLLFTWLLRGKYDHGLNLMPWGFVQYSWFSLLVIANKYLICVDKPRTGILPLLAGFASAVALNLALAPSWGLSGVVVAMTAANAIALASLLWVTAQCGMRWDSSVLLAAAIPLSMCLGGWAALGIIAALLVGGWENNWLVTLADRQYLHEAWSNLTGRVRRRWEAGSAAAI